MSEVVGEGVVRIRTDESGVDFAKSGKDAGAGYSKGFTSSLKGIATALGATVAVGGAVNLLKGSLSAARESQRIAATTEQIIKSTGGAAQVSATQVEQLTTALSKRTGVDDELIQSGANLILTFKNVQNAGEGVNAIFDRTNAAALDLSAAGFGSIESASLQLGKALNDPIKGMSALARSGVTFTAAQKAQVAALVETGDLLSAQKIILEEVESQVGGVAEATATAGDRARVVWGNLQEQLGTGLIPVVDRAAVLFTDYLVPGVSAAASVAGDAVDAFQALPGPVQTAAGAFVALRIATASGILGSGGDLARRTLTGVSSGMDSVRIRTLLARDAFNASRAGADGAAASNTRLTASLAAVRAGATGASTAVKGFAAAALPVVAITAGITALTSWAGASAEAKAEAEELTSTLDAQTGAFTENTKAFFANKLEKDGSLQDLRDLGIATKDYIAAILGEGDAYDRVRSQLETLQRQADEGLQLTDLPGAGDGDAAAYGRAIDLLEELSGNYDDAGESARRVAEATDESADATQGATRFMASYSTQIKDAQGALKALIDTENERREDLISDRRDQIALNQAIKQAREEARQGAGSRTGTQAEQDANEAALLDLVDQFNSSTNEVRRAEFGATRREFLRLADAMQIPKREAEELVRLLRVPKTADVKFQSEGYQELMAEIQRVTEAARRLDELGAIGVGPGRLDRVPALATGTSSFRGGMAWVGEEGPELVRLPRGTEVTPARESAAIANGTGGGISIRIEKLMPHNYSEFERQVLETARASSIGGRPVPVP